MPVRFIEENSNYYSWILLHQTMDSVVKCEEAAFTGTGITPQQFSVLAAVSRIRKPVTPTDVANWLDRNLNSISLIVDRMEKDGLIKRRRDLKDRRILRLVLTAKGEKAYTTALERAQSISTEIMSCLSAADMKKLVGVIEKVKVQTYKYRKLEPKLTESKHLFAKPEDAVV
jgi:MarR family 2-MHQ and catechol resistance regulon transcriptional repressor